MARIPVPFVVAVAVVFCSLTLSHARIPANIPGDEVTNRALPNSLPESDVYPTIRLPSDSESHSSEPVKEAQESETLSTVQSVPLNVVTFRPVDHRLRFRSRFPFRCRHHHHHHGFFMPMRQHQEIPYGDDMILSSGENADLVQGMFQGRVRRIPARWVKIHHHHHHDHEDEDGDRISRLMFKHSDEFDKEKFKMHKHHHHHDDDEEDKEERFKEHKERKEKGGGFMKRIRKILDHF